METGTDSVIGPVENNSKQSSVEQETKGMEQQQDCVLTNNVEGEPKTSVTMQIRKISQNIATGSPETNHKKSLSNKINNHQPGDIDNTSIFDIVKSTAPKSFDKKNRTDIVVETSLSERIAPLTHQGKETDDHFEQKGIPGLHIKSEERPEWMKKLVESKIKQKQEEAEKLAKTPSWIVALKNKKNSSPSK
jgi:hypothetical protein